MSDALQKCHTVWQYVRSGNIVDLSSWSLASVGIMRLRRNTTPSVLLTILQTVMIRGLYSSLSSMISPTNRCNIVKGFEPRSHFKSRLSLIVRVNIVLNRPVVVDSDWRFDKLCGSHLQSQIELYHVSWWCYTLAIDLIGQLRRDVIGYEDFVISNWCVNNVLLKMFFDYFVIYK